MRDNRIDVPQQESSALEALIRREIESQRPISFERFMDLALYAPRLGYYVRGQDPFGARGDFYTAEQLQPLFGILIAQFIAELRTRMGSPADFRVMEPGAGRAEMAAALAEFRYIPLEAQTGSLPAERFTGVVFANEFFDALPVKVAVRRDGVFRDMLVTYADGRFRFVDGAPSSGPCSSTFSTTMPMRKTGGRLRCTRARSNGSIESQVSRRLPIVIDYGYTARE